MDELAINLYLKNPRLCLICSHDVLGADHFSQHDETFTTRKVWCDSCGAKWTEVFELTNVEDIRE